MAQPYHALQQLLDKIETNASPAAVHGLWCGRIAAGDQLRDQEWWDYTLQVVGVQTVVGANMQIAFEAVANFAEANLQQENFSFEPWLPADSSNCDLRVTALSDWCRGFIEGLTSVLGHDLLDKPPEVTEMLQDLLAIGEVDSEVSGNEEDEKHLLELTEFVKVAALNLYHELGLMEQSSAPKNANGPTLH